MCTRLHRSGHTNLARVLQAALSEEPDISEHGGRALQDEGQPWKRRQTPLNWKHCAAVRGRQR